MSPSEIRLARDFRLARRLEELRQLSDKYVLIERRWIERELKAREDRRDSYPLRHIPTYHR